MDLFPVRARHVSKKSLRAKVLKEGVNDLHDVFDRMMQRHTLELHMLVEKWVSQGETAHSQSPAASAWGSRSVSPAHSRGNSAHGRRRLLDEPGNEHKLASMDHHMELETKAQHAHPYPGTSGSAAGLDTVYVASGRNRTFTGGSDDSRPGTADKLNSDASSRPGSADKLNLRSNVAAKDIESSNVPSLPGYVHHPDQPDPNTQPRLHWSISEDHEQDMQVPELPEEKLDTQVDSYRALARASLAGLMPKDKKLHRGDTRNVFMDVEQIKSQLKRDLTKKAHTTVDYYWQAGYARTIATNTIFENVTLTVILINALWMGYDANSNHASSLNDAELQFVIAEHFFAVFFTFEWIIRFAAFRNKCNCLRDFWFVFDSGLLIFMIAETWVLTAFASASGAKMFQGLRWLRLVRLTRLARIARLLRAVPELLIMVKAIVISLKTVSYTFVLLILVGYIFGVAFTILMEGREPRFDGVFTSMNTLLLAGALPDQADLVNYLKDNNSEPANYGYYVLIVLYLMIASLMMMNMLIGMLTEVISGVATLEKEAMMLTKVKENLQELLTTLHIISEEENEVTKQEFESLLGEPRAALLLQDVGVDVVGLVDFADYIFSDEKPVLSFEEFMDVVLQLRGSNGASVKDVIDLRKLISSEVKGLQKKVNRLSAQYGH